MFAFLLIVQTIIAGSLVGVILMAVTDKPSLGWAAPRILGTLGLWLAFLPLTARRAKFSSRKRRRPSAFGCPKGSPLTS